MRVTRLNETATIEDAAELREAGAMASGKRVTLLSEYITGTNPDDPEDEFTVSIDMVDGKPEVTFSPDNEELRATRTYTLLGKTTLSTDEEWTPVTEGEESNYNFFKVTVELKQADN